MSAKILRHPAFIKGPKKRPALEKAMRAYADEFYQWMLTMNYSKYTVINRRYFFKKFLVWCDDRGIYTPHEVTLPLIERFQKHLYEYRDPETGEGLSINGQRATAEAIRMFFRWMRKHAHMKTNPASEVELPLPERRLSGTPLTHEEVEKVLALPDVTTALGLRDRALMEVIYSTGIRRSEVAALTRYDINARFGTLLVRLGKGKKDRMLPIGARAIAWVEKYVLEGRPSLVADPDHGRLFVGKKGKPLRPVGAGYIVSDYVKASGLRKKGSCHLLRHAMATAMLDNGAETRHVQEMLGHDDLRSTQAYTKVAIKKLKEVHSRVHPSSKLLNEEKLKKKGPRSRA